MSDGPQSAFIYCLEDPRDESVRYVGKTIQPLNTRLQQHVYPARVGKHNHSKAVWIRELLSVGLNPRIRLLQKISETEWRAAERLWVETLRSAGAALTNEAPAGAGGDTSHTGKIKREHAELLGVIPDDELAEIVGLSTAAIRYHRKVKNIPPFAGKRNNGVCRRRVSPEIALNVRPEILELLGKQPDHEVAKLFGLSRRTIGDYRQSFGISKCGNRPDKTTRLKLDEPTINRLGKEPDYRIAASIGASKPAIARARKRLGIAPYAQTSGANGKFQKGNFPARWKRDNSYSPPARTAGEVCSN